MTWISYGNTVIAPIVPLLLVAPKFLAGEVTQGGVMQVSLAFVQVQAALNWFVANYARLVEWYASVVRVVALEEALGRLGEPTAPAEELSPGWCGLGEARNAAFTGGSGDLMEAVARSRTASNRVYSRVRTWTAGPEAASLTRQSQ